MSVSQVSTASTLARTGLPQTPEARLYAEALIRQHGTKYGEIVRQLDALQAKAETAEFGYAVEKEVRSLLGSNASKLDSAVYYIGGKSFSRYGETPDAMRQAAEIDAQRPVAKRSGAYERYMLEDRQFGDGKFATNDANAINDGWRSMIAAGASTPAEFNRIAQAADRKLDRTITDFQNRFSAPGLEKLAGGKISEGFLKQLNQNERVEGKNWSQDIAALLRKSPEIYAAYQFGVIKGVGKAAWDMVSSVAALAGKIIQYSGDTSTFGALGKLGDAARSAMPQWVKDAAGMVGADKLFNAVTPSYTRGIESQKAIAGLAEKVTNYFQSRSPGQIGDDIANALSAKWDSIKDEFNALNGDPVKQAEWIGEKVGYIAFEIASTVIPVTKAGTVAKIADNTADVVTGIDKVADIAKTADRLEDAADATRIGKTATGAADDILTRAKTILGDLPLNSKSLDELYRAGKLTMDEARTLAKNVGWKDGSGQWIYPPNDGFHTPGALQTIKTGDKLDRYGGFIDRDTGLFRDTGNFLSPAGESYGARALPPGTKDAKALKIYEVKVPFEATVGKATPWFDEPGMATQIMTDRTMNIEYLLKRGYITEIK
ncbi:MAG: TNT domain-containing protein [Sphingorhabdus sp.]